MAKKVTKVMLALPCMDGYVASSFADSLVKETMHAITRDIVLYPFFLNGCSAVHIARNLLTSEFFNSDYDVLFFIDTDQAWKTGDVCDLIEKPVDIAGGVARMKREPEEYKLNWLHESNGTGKDFTVTKDDNGLIEVESFGTCFTKIARKAIVKMISDNPHLQYKQSGATSGYAWALFQPTLEDGMNYGEDISFCKLARKSGFKIYLAPELYFAHIGMHYFWGSVENHFGKNVKS